MAGNARRMLRLLGLYARMDLHWFTQDTLACGLCIVSDIISNLASLSGVLLLAVRFGGVGGLSADDMLLMLGFYTMVTGLVFMCFGFNIGAISRRIGRGQVDHMLIQPVPLWMQILTEGFMPVSGSSGFVCGVILTFVAIRRLGLAVTPLWLLSLLLYLLVAVGVLMGINFLSGSAAFYRPAACEELSSLTGDLMGTLGKFPLFGLPGWLTGALVTVLPVGLIGWLPSLVLLGALNRPTVYLGPVLVAATFLLLARYAFEKGMRYYVQHGCNRYRDMGHRS